MMLQRLLSRAHPVARRLSSEGPSGRTKRIMTRAEASVDTVSEKQRLLSLIDGTSRGLTTSDEVAQSIEQQCQLLEGMNPTEKPLASPLVNGKWELVYTTSNSILGKSKGLLRPRGPIYQTIDAENLKAKNNETWPLFNQVKADLTALSDSKVAVQFTFFKLLGLLPIPAPPNAKGELDVTFLDEEMRISRGDKGNLFVLMMRDRDARP